MPGFPKPGLPWPDVELDPFQRFLRTAATEVIAREAPDVGMWCGSVEACVHWPMSPSALVPINPVPAREASAKVFGGLADKTASIGGTEQ
jgi:hypothetical protein